MGARRGLPSCRLAFCRRRSWWMISDVLYVMLVFEINCKMYKTIVIYLSIYCMKKRTVDYRTDIRSVWMEYNKNDDDEVNALSMFLQIVDQKRSSSKANRHNARFMRIFLKHIWYTLLLRSTITSMAWYGDRLNISRQCDTASQSSTLELECTCATTMSNIYIYILYI